MYYKVIVGGKPYYSKEIVKSYLHMGDDMIQREVLSGELKMLDVMDRMVYELPASELSEVDRQYVPVVQDLDAVLKGFSPAPDVTETVIVDPKADRWTYKKYTFVKLGSVRAKNRYKIQRQLPMLEVCGMKYVALGCCKAGENLEAR